MKRKGFDITPTKLYRNAAGGLGFDVEITGSAQGECETSARELEDWRLMVADERAYVRREAERRMDSAGRRWVDRWVDFCLPQWGITVWGSPVTTEGLVATLREFEAARAAWEASK